MCHDESPKTDNGGDAARPEVDQSLIVQGTRDGKPKVDQTLIVNLKASETTDPNTVLLAEDASSEGGDSSNENE